MTRAQILRDCPEDFEECLKDILDHFENRVNSALYLLKEIKSVGDLGNIERCQSELESLSADLY